MHVILTGASSGIGEPLAKEYLRRGANLTLVARRTQKLEEIAEGHEDRCHIVTADLADYAHACDWVDEALGVFGDVDVLINNAGVQIVGKTTDTGWEDAESMLHLNVFAPFKLTMKILPMMLARKKGTIVDISSMAALAPTPGMFFYNASKAALGAASESLRGELLGTGVHVMTVYPGPVRTPMETRGRAALEETAASRLSPVGDPDELASMICDGVKNQRSRIIYPGVYG